MQYQSEPSARARNSPPALPVAQGSVIKQQQSFSVCIRGEPCVLLINFQPSGRVLDTADMHSYLSQPAFTQMSLEEFCGAVFKDLTSALDSPESLCVKIEDRTDVSCVRSVSCTLKIPKKKTASVDDEGAAAQRKSHKKRKRVDPDAL